MIDRLKDNAPRFVEKIVSEVRALGIIEIDRWDIDHLCFRTESETDYDATKTLFAEFSELLVETPINGRPIATFRLNELLRCGNHSINVFELPAPKPGKPYARGLEHIEIVIDMPLQDLRDSHPHLSWDDSNMESPVNPDISLSVDRAVVKFHPMALENVIAWEIHPHHEIACNAQIEMKVSDFKPRISGSIPIGVANEKSDVDILCQAKNLKAFSEHCEKAFGQNKNFESHITEKYGVPSIVANFAVGRAKFQIFAQDLPVEKQVSNLHLLVEARLLKLGGRGAREAISKLKREGEKTEPAFGKYFKLGGDPYQQLLELQKLSEPKLRARLSLTTP
jgi:uncharacterized protein